MLTALCRACGWRRWRTGRHHAGAGAGDCHKEAMRDLLTSLREKKGSEAKTDELLGWDGGKASLPGGLPDAVGTAERGSASERRMRDAAASGGRRWQGAKAAKPNDGARAAHPDARQAREPSRADRPIAIELNRVRIMKTYVSI